MVNIYRRAQSERIPQAATGSPKAEVGEIDTRAPFQSVKAAVSLFGEVAVTKERRTPRKSRISAENVIDKETQLLLAEKEFNNIKQKLESDEATKTKAESELESAKQTLQELTDKLRAVTESMQSAIEAAEAMKHQDTQLELKKSQYSQEYEAELESAREQYLAVANELDAKKQELNKIRQDFDAALEVKMAAFQQAAESQLSAKMHSERVTELTKQITAMQEAIKQVKFATQQVYNEQEAIAAEKEMLRKSYQVAKEEAEKKLSASREAYDPELTKALEQKLTETTAEVEALQEEMKKVHALEMDSVRLLTSELNEATTTLQMVADEECSLRNLVSSMRVELEEVKRKQAQQNEIIAKKEAEREALNHNHNVRLQQLLLEAETARKEAEEMKNSIESLKKDAEAAEMAVKELKQKLDDTLEQAEEAKAAEKEALDEMRVLEKGVGDGKILLSKEEYEALQRKIDEYGIMSEQKIAAAMVELEAIISSKNEAEEKVEENLKAIEEIKAATELAEKSAMTAEAAQNVVEGELRRRREQEEAVASS